MGGFLGTVLVNLGGAWDLGVCVINLVEPGL